MLQGAIRWVEGIFCFHIPPVSYAVIVFLLVDFVPCRHGQEVCYCWGGLTCGCGGIATIHVRQKCSLTEDSSNNVMRCVNTAGGAVV